MLYINSVCDARLTFVGNRRPLNQNQEKTESFFSFLFQVASEFILESERESFIEQIREVIEMADEKREGMKEGFHQVFLHYTSSHKPDITFLILAC